STCAITPITGAAILISPEEGSTRPGATVCQRLSSATSGRDARAASCAPVRAANAANTNTNTTARTADLFLDPSMLFGVIMDNATAFVFFECCTATLFAHDASVFDVNHSISEAQYTRVVRDDQHPARAILGNLRHQRPHPLPLFTFQRRRGSL